MEGGEQLGRWLIAGRAESSGAWGATGLGGLVGHVDGHGLAVCGAVVVFAKYRVLESVFMGDVAVAHVV